MQTPLIIQSLQRSLSCGGASLYRVLLSAESPLPSAFCRFVKFFTIDVLYYIPLLCICQQFNNYKKSFFQLFFSFFTKRYFFITFGEKTCLQSSKMANRPHFYCTTEYLSHNSITMFFVLHRIQAPTFDIGAFVALFCAFIISQTFGSVCDFI